MDLYVKILRLFVAGALGVDFSVNTDNIEEGVAKVAKGILEHGVTSFCPTIVTSSESTYKQVHYADGTTFLKYICIPIYSLLMKYCKSTFICFY